LNIWFKPPICNYIRGGLWCPHGGPLMLPVPPLGAVPTPAMVPPHFSGSHHTSILKCPASSMSLPHPTLHPAWTLVWCGFGRAAFAHSGAASTATSWRLPCWHQSIGPVRYLLQRVRPHHPLRGQGAGGVPSWQPFRDRQGRLHASPACRSRYLSGTVTAFLRALCGCARLDGIVLDVIASLSTTRDALPLTAAAIRLAVTAYHYLPRLHRHPRLRLPLSPPLPRISCLVAAPAFSFVRQERS